MAEPNKTIKYWKNASISLSVIAIPAFLWFVIGGASSVLSTNKPPLTFVSIILIGVILLAIQWSINSRQKWAILSFYLLIPINLLGSYLGWLSLLIMLINWKKMTWLLKNRTKKITDDQIMSEALIGNGK